MANKKQLSLFPKNLSEELKQKQADGKLVEVVFHCEFCKYTTAIKPHIPIHSWDWMDKNWTKIAHNKYSKSGFCSRECETGNGKKVKNEKSKN
jgi:hypothetical protein